MKPHLFPTSRLIAATTALAFLAGCTTFSKDGCFDTVSTTAAQRLGKDAVLVRTDEDRNAIAKRTQELLSRPLGMDDAIQIASRWEARPVNAVTNPPEPRCTSPCAWKVTGPRLLTSTSGARCAGVSLMRRRAR